MLSSMASPDAQSRPPGAAMETAHWSVPAEAVDPRPAPLALDGDQAYIPAVYTKSGGWPMAVTTRVFLTNKTQAVRLPRDVAFPAGVDEVEVLVIGKHG